MKGHFLKRMFPLGLGLGLLSTVGLCSDFLAALDEDDPFYVHRDFPKLITPQWVGEEGVEAVVVLAIDDMREHAKYETYLRPVLERLKSIDGSAHVSIMSNALDPAQPHLRNWLSEGVSLEVHTLSHPCPLLARNDFESAEDTYFGGIDLLNHVPGNQPVAFRMPCCDSINSPSPRFYSALFNRKNPAGQFLQLDSSVMCSFTSDDPDLPRNLVLNEAGEERFSRYLPFDSFVTTIENYPYPYVIGKQCWEFPCMVPSDWEAQNMQGSNHPDTVRDWKIALDLTVLKQGVFNLVFHPHGWIRSEQVVELIDYAQSRYGGRVKFLNFREAVDRLNRHLLAGESLRANTGGDNGVRLIDLNADGFQDVVIGNSRSHLTRVWQPDERRWIDFGFPVDVVDLAGQETGLKFGVFGGQGHVSALVRTEDSEGAWEFRADHWLARPELIRELRVGERAVVTRFDGTDTGMRVRDVDGDDRSEVITSRATGHQVLEWSEERLTWISAGYGLPPEVSMVDPAGRDNGVRFVDVNADGLMDLIQSNEERYSLHLYIPELVLGFVPGWSRQVVNRARSPRLRGIPPIVRGGDHRNNGAWFHSGHLWVQNEETAALPDLVDRRSFSELLTGDIPLPLDAAVSIDAMEYDPSLVVELVAAEPLLTDPVYFDWGADGRLWVVEMGDYPMGIDGEGRPGGQVRTLWDDDGDGRYDRSQVFLDELNFPTGLFPWGEGLVVSAAPEIFYAEDRDGDGRADFRETWFTGFREGNQQHRVNGFSYGLDHWLYGANGDSGGEIGSPGSDERVSLSRRDFRFAPWARRFESIEGQTQFGRHRDDWGNWFGNNNPNWLWHYWFPERYLANNPHFRLRTNKRYLGRSDPYVFAIGEGLQRFNEVGHRDHVTAANSATPYRDVLFPGDYQRSVFVSEPVHNVIHREVLSRQGVSFDSQRADSEKNREFLASRDPWFRPTSMRTGPDGALYFADMYRLVIEHPEWIPEDVAAALDLGSGRDRGRLYRVFPKGRPPRAIPAIGHESSTELVARLSSENGWVRDTVQRLLIERQDPTVALRVRELLLTSDRPKTQLHCLWTLRGLDDLRISDVAVGLASSSGELRRNAIRLAEQILRHAEAGELRDSLVNRLVDLSSDPWESVRFQLALTAGSSSDHRFAGVLATLAGDKPSPEVVAAIEVSLPGHLDVLAALLVRTNESLNDHSDLYQLVLRYGVLLRRSSLVGKLLEAILATAAGEIDPAVFGVIADYQATIQAEGLVNNVDYALNEQAPKSRSVAYKRVWGMAERVAKDLGRSDEGRLVAWRLLTQSERGIAMLGELFNFDESALLQENVLQSLSRMPSRQVLPHLEDVWPQLRPTLREIVVRQWVRDPSVLKELLPSIEQGAWPGLLGIPMVRNLGQSAGLLNRKRVGLPEDFREVLQEVFSRTADPRAGAKLFAENCFVCHQSVNGEPSVGPDLKAVSDRSTQGLLLAILQPNRAVEAKYLSYSVDTKNGESLTGIIENESAGHLQLRLGNGDLVALRRAEILNIQGSGLSLMPEGLGDQVGLQGLSDLIGFLQTY